MKPQNIRIFNEACVLQFCLKAGRVGRACDLAPLLRRERKRPAEKRLLTGHTDYQTEQAGKQTVNLQ
jgi:hypothetical protein